MIPVSVLMSTYKKDSLSYLVSSVKSICDQTLKPNQIVIVIDGEIPEENKKFLYKIRSEVRGITITLVWNESNQGLAVSLNNGLQFCQEDFIARMDSDDIAYPNRLEKQWSFLSKNLDIDILSTWHAEFSSDPNEIFSIKKTPCQDQKIKKALKFRNIISHPTILIRKKVLVDIGGYSSKVGLLEDYDLYIRLALAGKKFACIQEPLVKVRTDQRQRERRGGARYAINELKFRYYIYSVGYNSFFEFITYSILMFCFRLTPSNLKKFLYQFVRDGHK